MAGVEKLMSNYRRACFHLVIPDSGRDKHTLGKQRDPGTQGCNFRKKEKYKVSV